MPKEISLKKQIKMETKDNKKADTKLKCTQILKQRLKLYISHIRTNERINIVTVLRTPC